MPQQGHAEPASRAARHGNRGSGAAPDSHVANPGDRCPGCSVSYGCSSLPYAGCRRCPGQDGPGRVRTAQQRAHNPPLARSVNRTRTDALRTGRRRVHGQDPERIVGDSEHVPGSRCSRGCPGRDMVWSSAPSYRWVLVVCWGLGWPSPPGLSPNPGGRVCRAGGELAARRCLSTAGEPAAACLGDRLAAVAAVRRGGLGGVAAFRFAALAPTEGPHGAGARAPSGGSASSGLDGQRGAAVAAGQVGQGVLERGLGPSADGREAIEGGAPGMFGRCAQVAAQEVHEQVVGAGEVLDVGAGGLAGAWPGMDRQRPWPAGCGYRCCLLRGDPPRLLFWAGW